MKIPRKNSLVKCVDKEICALLEIKEKDFLLFLGEIPNMPGGHCIVVLPNKKIVWGFHTSNFVELTEDEV